MALAAASWSLSHLPLVSMTHDGGEKNRWRRRSRLRGGTPSANLLCLMAGQIHTTVECLVAEKILLEISTKNAD